MADGTGGYSRGQPVDPRAALSDIAVRLTSLIKIGKVEEVDYSKPRARVRIGKLLTNWLPWSTVKASQDVEWNPPEVGEQVLVLSPSGDLAQAVIACSLYQTAHPANGSNVDKKRVDYKDGSFVEYDRSSHEFRHHLNSGGKFTFDVGNAVIEVVDGKIELKVGGETTHTLTDGMVESKVGSKHVTVTAGKVEINT